MPKYLKISYAKPVIPRFVVRIVWSNKGYSRCAAWGWNLILFLFKHNIVGFGFCCFATVGNKSPVRENPYLQLHPGQSHWPQDLVWCTQYQGNGCLWEYLKLLICTIGKINLVKTVQSVWGNQPVVLCQNRFRKLKLSLLPGCAVLLKMSGTGCSLLAYLSPSVNSPSPSAKLASDISDSWSLVHPQEKPDTKGFFFC